MSATPIEDEAREAFNSLGGWNGEERRKFVERRRTQDMDLAYAAGVEDERARARDIIERRLSFDVDDNKQAILDALDRL